MKKLQTFLIFFAITIFSLVTLIAPMEPKAFAAAGNQTQISPQQILINQNTHATNTLGLMGHDCHDFKRNDATWKKCEAYQSVLHKYIGCSDQMFEAPTDPNDSSVKLDNWFVKSAEYKACYSEVSNILTSINGPKCKNMKKLGTNDNGYDSSAWKLCQQWQDKLYNAINCSKTMFKPASQAGYYTADTADVNRCKARVDAAGNLSLITAAGTESGTVAATAPSDGISAGGDNSNIDKLSCDYSSSMLSWAVCPIIDGLVLFIGFADGIITQQLEVDTSKIFCDQGDENWDTCKAYYTAWQRFRDIALGLLVIVGLIIVISQALGLEVLDAYMIRKTLPRLLVAAIGITLSWSIMQLLVTFTNDLGYGIRALIYAPFNTLQDQIDLTFGENIGATFFAAAGLYVVGVFGVLSYAITAVLAVFVAVLVLILRQIAIIIMITLAPVAILMYILPNTQKYYKFWWESFSKALLMFPLIAAFIAAGRVFSAIALKGDGPISQMIGFIAYFAPYFLIPMTFKFAGSAVGTLGGFVNDKSRGGFDRLSKFRSGQTQKNVADMKSGTRLEGKKWIPGSIKASTAINEASKGIGTGWKGRYGVGKRGFQARRGVDNSAAIEAQKSQGMQNIKGWNDVNRVLAMGMGDERAGHAALVDHLQHGGDDGDTFLSKEAATERANTAVLAAKTHGNFTKAHGIAAFRNMAADGTAIRDVQDLATLAAKAGQGDLNNTYGFAADAAGVSKQVGRSDIAASPETIGALALETSDHLGNRTGNKKIYKGGESLDVLEHAAWKNATGGEVPYQKFSSAKGRAIRNDTRRAVDIMKTHREALLANQPSPYSAETVEFAAMSLVEAQTAIENNYGKLNNRDEAGKELSKDEGALNWYLDTATTVKDTDRVEGPLPQGTPAGTPIYTTKERGTTNREVVKKKVGDRMSNMTEQQRQQYLRDSSKKPGGEDE